MDAHRQAPIKHRQSGFASHIHASIRQFCCVLACCLLFAPGNASAWPGKVVGISDGDTITVLRNDRQPVKIRLYGIDCPEKRQAWGGRAKEATAELCYGKVVEVHEMGIDRYGRTVAIVILPDGASLQEKLVGSALAWIWPRYCKEAVCLDWMELEEKAEAAKIGLWQDEDPIPPWEWRHTRK